MAYYYKNGSGIDSSAYIYVQLQVTRTDYPTYSHFSVKSVAVSDTGSSSFIRGQVTTNQAGNSWTAATGWKNVSYNGTTTLATATFDVTRGASDKTARIGAYAEGGGTGIYAGGTDYAWLNVTVPKVLAPNAPTGCTATYVSDSQASVSWTNGTTDSDHPRDATLVERRDGSNDWAQVASASGTASSFTDNGISANTQYQYRVRAKNVAGYSAYSTSGSIYTTPAAPASVTLDKTAATTMQVDVTGTWGYAVTYDIESTYDGGSTWASVATSTSLPYSATVNAGTVQFRVRAVRGALSSAWTNSASLVTICPPLAPTIVQAPANPTAYGDGSTIAWTPNHPDGSAQASAEVKVTNPGGTSTTYTVSTATSYSFTPNATGTWTAQVRTKGLDPSYGEWSQTVSWGVANPPAVVITSPATDGTDVVSLPMTVSWSVTDSTGVSAQRIIIEGSDGEILNRTLAGDVRSVSLNASDVALENGQTYTIRLRVMGGSGLVTEQTRIFDVAWLAPAAPVLQLTEGEGRSATIDVMDTHYSESGATIAVDGSAIADSFTVFGASVQDGTPTPSAPVPIESVAPDSLGNISLWARGRNLLAPQKEGTFGGVTFTVNDDGSVTLNNTATTTVNQAVMFTVPETGAYTLSGCPAGGSASTYQLWTYDTTTPRDPQLTDTGSGATGTFTEGHVISVRIRIQSGYTCSNLTFYPQLEAGSTATAYQPYTYTAYPIDLQGNALRSLPDGTRDELDVDAEGNVVLTQRVGRAVLDGSETWTVGSGRNFGGYTGLNSVIKIPPNTTTPTNSYCNLVPAVQAQNATVAVNIYKFVGVAVGSTGTVFLNLVGDAGGTTVDALKAALAATPAELLYPLATPQTISLGTISDFPFIPEDGTMWVDGTTMEATLRPADYAGQPPIDSVDVQRVNADGTAWTVATGLTVGGSCIDPLPPLGVEVTYIATASAASGATASERYTATIGGRTWALNAGAAAQEHMELRYNPQASYAMEHGGEAYHFADGGAGGGRPVFYPTTDRDESGTLKFDTVDKDDTDALRAMSDRNPVMWLRDPFGHRWRAHVRPSSSHGVGRIWQLSIAWDAVRMKEAW